MFKNNNLGLYTVKPGREKYYQSNQIKDIIDAVRSNKMEM